MVRRTSPHGRVVEESHRRKAPIPCCKIGRTQEKADSGQGDRLKQITGQDQLHWNKKRKFLEGGLWVVRIEQALQPQRGREILLAVNQ